MYFPYGFPKALLTGVGAAEGGPAIAAEDRARSVLAARPRISQATEPERRVEEGKLNIGRTNAGGT
jgi:hypothetical protein